MTGVVATASYEARAFGARSAMSTAEARRRCPSGTAFLGGRFAAYRRTSDVVMALLRELSPLVEPVSIDEAYVDLAAGDHDLSVAGVTALALDLKARMAIHTSRNRAADPAYSTCSGPTPRTFAIGPSTARTTSATLIPSGSRASQ